MRYLISIFILSVLGLFIYGFKIAPPVTKELTNPKPTISFTFDDGKTKDQGGYKLEVWNEMLLENLKKNNLKTIFFSMGWNKLDDRGKYVLKSWSDAGHKIANHTFTHPNFNDKAVTLDDFKKEFLKNDSVIRQYPNYYPYFRFPYLKEGNTKEKIDGMRKFLKDNGCKNGHVTVDASDWYIDSRLVKRLEENPNADLSGFKSYYIQHLYSHAMHFDSISFQLTNRRISHVLLLHHNLSSALFLGDLIKYFKANGWEVMDADKAYQDPIYKEVPTTVPAGESLIWSLGKQSGKFEKQLGPASDWELEKGKMDKLGL